MKCASNPKLELQASCLLYPLRQEVQRAFSLNIEGCFMWTDSTTELQWFDFFKNNLFSLPTFWMKTCNSRLLTNGIMYRRLIAQQTLALFFRAAGSKVLTPWDLLSFHLNLVLTWRRRSIQRNRKDEEDDPWDDETYGTCHRQCINFSVANVQLSCENFAHCAVYVTYFARIHW